MYGPGERQELIGSRIDQDMIPKLNKIVAALPQLQQILDSFPQIEARLKTGIRRDARARLYQDDTTKNMVAAKVTDGFWYPLNKDPVLAQGQLASLRVTQYLLIDADEVVVVLPHQQFLNLKEMADSHLRRIALAVSGGQAALNTLA